MASLVLSIAGNVLGGPVGAAVGGLLGSYIDANYIAPEFVDRPKIKPPQLGDLSIQNVDEGAPANHAIGPETPIVGAVMWTSDFIVNELEDEVGGKGGGREVTTGYAVYVNVAVCVTHNELLAIKKIKAEGNLLYDDDPDQALTSSQLTFVKRSGTNIDIKSPVGGPDLSIFRSGFDIVVAGASNSANDGTFRVDSARQWPDGSSRLRIRNPLGSNEAAGALIALSQALPKFDTKKVENIAIYLGTSTQNPDPIMESFEDTGNVPAYRGVAYVVFKNLYLNDYGNRIPQFTFIVKESASMTAGEAIEKIMARAKESGATVLASEATRPLSGYPIRGLLSTVHALQQVQIALNVLDQETDGGAIRFFDRERAFIEDVLEEDLGAIEFGGTRKGTVEVLPEPERQAPSEVHIGYIDLEADNQHGSQHQNRPLNHFLSEKLEFQLVLAGAGAEARQLAMTILWLRELERHRYRLPLPPKYMHLLENDVIRVPVHGRVETLLIERIDMGDNFMLELECTRERREVLSQVGIADAPSAGGNRVPTPPLLIAVPLDMAYGGTPTPGPGPGVPFSPPTTGGGVMRPRFGLAIFMADDDDEWPGALIFESTGESYTAIATVTREGKGGVCRSTLGTATPGIWDHLNSLTVEMLSGTLSSRSESEVLSGQNRAWVGGEIIGFKTVTQHPMEPNTYILSDLLRGLRDTRHLIGAHGADEDFVYLNGGGITAVEIPVARIGVPFDLKAVPIGHGLDDVEEITTTVDAVNLRPFSPVSLAAVRPIDELTVSWTRRTREICRLFGPKPVAEAFERYEVEVAPEGGDPVLTVVVDDATSVTIAAADLEDAGIFPETAVDIFVYQMSDVVGRSRAASVSLAGV